MAGVPHCWLGAEGRGRCQGGRRSSLGVALWVQGISVCPVPLSPGTDQDIWAPHGPSITSLGWFCRTGPREDPSQARAALLLLSVADCKAPLPFSSLSQLPAVPSLWLAGSVPIQLLLRCFLPDPLAL